MAHALLTPKSPYPRIIIARGHLLDSLGISVRYPAGPTGKSKTYIELLPEEALYLLERGSLQVWTGRAATAAEEAEEGLGDWSEEEHGVRGAVELSVMEGFATFIGQDGLSWERYQVSFVYFIVTTQQMLVNGAQSRHMPTSKGSAILCREPDGSCQPILRPKPTFPVGQVQDGRQHRCPGSKRGGNVYLTGSPMLSLSFITKLCTPFDLSYQQGCNSRPLWC
jgi:hypothetical protein